MKLKHLLLGVIAAVAFTSSNASAMLWLGYLPGNDNDEAQIEAFLGGGIDISLLGKSDAATNPTGFTPNLSTLHGLSSGNISYTGTENISYLTFKVGNAGTTGPGGKDSDHQVGFHLYSFMDGPFNLLTDPNPDFVGEGNTISHISVWTTKRTDQFVPEGGATLALLGLGLAGLSFGRRFLKKA